MLLLAVVPNSQSSVVIGTGFDSISYGNWHNISQAYRCLVNLLVSVMAHRPNLVVKVSAQARQKIVLLFGCSDLLQSIILLELSVDSSISAKWWLL